MTRVLLLGAGGNAGKNFIRSLRMAKTDYYIVGCDINAYHLATSGADVNYVVPLCTNKEYLSELKNIIFSENIDFIHAQPDIEVETISKYRDEINARYFLPDHSTILVCRNKWETNQILGTANVPVPDACQVRNHNEMAHAFRYFSQYGANKLWMRPVTGAGSKAALPVNNLAIALQWLDYWAEKSLETHTFMLSEFLPGDEFAFQSVWLNGTPLTSAARQRVEYMFGNMMPSGQSSSPSIAKSVHNDAVNRIATNAILAVDPKATGVFCVDMKCNSDGIPCVTEINAGRFFTTSDFFARIGANMPHIYVEHGAWRMNPKYQVKLHDLPMYDAVPANMLWVRGVDEPAMLMEAPVQQEVTLCQR